MLKRLSLYGLICLVLTNSMGLYLLVLSFDLRNSHLLNSRFNNDQIQELQLVEFEIPLAIPYGPLETSYNRIDGRFTFNNTVYRLVKQRVENGKLLVICAVDGKDQQVRITLKDLSESQIPFAPESGLLKHLAKDYLPVSYFSSTPDFMVLDCNAIVPYNSRFYPTFSSTILQPPEFLS